MTTSTPLICETRYSMCSDSLCESITPESVATPFFTAIDQLGSAESVSADKHLIALLLRDSTTWLADAGVVIAFVATVLVL